MPEPQTATLPPHAQLVQMGTAHWMSHVLYVAATLGLADHLANGRTRVDDLAAATKTHSLSLGRFLRTLGHLGLVTEDGAGRFALTPLGAALQTGAPGSARAAILTLASPWMTNGWTRLLESVQTGKPGLEQTLGVPIFDWLAQHPEEASLFSETMVSFHGVRIEKRPVNPFWYRTKHAMESNGIRSHTYFSFQGEDHQYSTAFCLVIERDSVNRH